MRITSMIAITGALVAALPATANAAAFINGGFESSATVNPGGGFATLGSGSTAIDGWQVIGDSIDYIGGYWQAAEGNRSIDLNGNGTGGIQQTFDTITGKLYNITFSLAGNPDAGPNNKTVLTVGTGGSALISNFNTTGFSKANMGWLPYSYSFKAGGTQSTISFTSLTSGAYGAALDAVSVSVVPEPATWAMMILGIGLVGGALRRRQQSVRYNFA